MKLSQIFKTTVDDKLEVSLDGGVTLSGNLSIDTTGLAHDTTLTNGTQRSKVEGLGTAGSQSGGVLTVQGDPSGTPVPITGSFFASILAVGADNATAPAYSIELGGIDPSGKLQGIAGSTTTPTGSEFALLVRPVGAQSVVVSNLPATQTVSGVVSVTNPIAISNFPSVQTVSVNNFPTTQDISGTVAVSNLPATQTIAGHVTVDNIPSVQQVVGGVVVSGNVGVNNFPANQTVTVSNLPLTQTISGHVMVDSLPSITVANPVTSVAINNLPVTQQVQVKAANVAALSSVEATTSSVVLLSGNSNRMQAIIVNDSPSLLYVAYAPISSSGLCSYILADGQTLELISQPIYNGIISGVWAGAIGSAKITEVIV